MSDLSGYKTKFSLKKLKTIFWPIDKYEHQLFIPMAFMMFCMLFNFAALRSIKDSLVVPNIGAEVISFLKLWFVLPSTLIFTVLYVKLSNKFNYEYVFYIIISFFLGFFGIFTFVIFPSQDFFHPSEITIQNLALAYPNLKWFIFIFGKWSYALMYIFCELWSAVIINLLFWQYANHIFEIKSAKRFYPILGMVGNLGLIAAGATLVSFSDLTNIHDPELLKRYTTDIGLQSERILKPIISTVLLSGAVAMLLYGYIERKVLPNMREHNNFVSSKKKTKTKLSVRESIRLLINSKYIGHIVILVLCYGLVINLLEGPWKSKVSELYPNTIDYMNFMGKFNIYMGMTCVTFMVIGSNILRRFEWTISALVTPFVISITGLIFFIFVLVSNNKVGGIFSVINPLWGAVVIGAMQNILSKSTKYSLFDSTKEMAYMPLSLELRTKGKACVEVIGLKFGKSLGAFMQSIVFIILPIASFDSIIIYLMVIFMIIMYLWVWNIKELGKEFEKVKDNA